MLIFSCHLFFPLIRLALYPFRPSVRIRVTVRIRVRRRIKVRARIRASP